MFFICVFTLAHGLPAVLSAVSDFFLLYLQNMIVASFGAQIRLPQ